MAHELAVRVRFSELDPYDHVNHAVYVSYLEAGRVEALASRGLDLVRLKEEGLQIVATELHARFLAPIGAGEDLVVRTRVEEVRRASSRWRQEIVRGDEVVVEARLVGAITDLEGRPVRIPESMRKTLESLQRSSSDPDPATRQ